MFQRNSLRDAARVDGVALEILDLRTGRETPRHFVPFAGHTPPATDQRSG